MKTYKTKTDIPRLADILRQGGLVAVPTETVYGLAGNGLDESAVERLYTVKGRPAVKALSLMVPGAEAMERYCRSVPRSAYILAEAFWPGPLTIILESGELVPSLVRAGGTTVGLRCPAQEQTLSLLQTCGVPLAAPSANPSGEPSPKTAEAVAAYFDGKIDAILDGGACDIGTESTILDLTTVPYRILRPGALSEGEIQRVLIASLRVVGVTGGTGTGKTTALNALREMGALVIDADEVYHTLCASCTDMLSAIEDRFPGTVEAGVLQRKRLGTVVFGDAKALEDLRHITDPFVEREIDRRLAVHAAAGGRYAAVDAINLLDTKLMSYVVASVGITAPEEVRVKRLMARDNIPEEYARLRIRAQHDETYFEENCDYTIRNDGTAAEYRMKCDALFGKILKE